MASTPLTTYSADGPFHADWKVSTLIDPDGAEVTVIKHEGNAEAAKAIADKETLVAGVWTRITIEPISAKLCFVSVAIRTVPGNPLITTTPDPIGTLGTVVKTLKSKEGATFGEEIVGNVWTYTYSEDPPFLRGFENHSGDLVIWEVAESRPVPGPWIYDLPVENSGVLVSIKRRLNSIAPLDGIAGTGITQGASALVTTEQTKFSGSTLVAEEKVTTLSQVFNEAEQSKTSREFIPERFKTAVVETENSSVSTGTDVDVSTPPVGGMNRKQRLTEFTVKTIERTSDITSGTSLEQYKLTEYGVAQVTETLAVGVAVTPTGIDGHTLGAEAATIPGNYSITTKTQLGATEAIITNVISSGEIDPQTKLATITEKYLVTKGSEIVGYTAPWFYEYRPAPFSSESKIQLRSKIVSYPDPATPEILYRRINVRFQDVLTSVEWVTAWAWADNTTTFQFASAFALKANITEGYQGPRVARVERTFHATLPTVPTGLWMPMPVEVIIGVTSAWFLATTNQCEAKATANTATIRATLHGELTIPDPGGTGSSAVAIASPDSIPATVPAALPEEVLYDFEITPLRLGGYMMEKFYVKTGVPA